MAVSLIERVPVEIIHRIFDHLDVETIICSVRPLCRMFRSVVITYDRYNLDLRLVSKRNFYILCRLINPKNVISLILSNDNRTSNQIDLFISLFDHLQQFTRLRSVTLLNIDESQLQIILLRLHLNLITSFSFSIRKYNDNDIHSINNLLTSIITQPNVRKMEFNIEKYRLTDISWSPTCSIQYLTINNDIKIDNLLKIFECSPHLHTLTMYGISDMFPKSSKSFPQILSLTIKEYWKTIDQLELFLLLTPSLIYLKLIGNGEDMLNGKRWESLITRNLPYLNKFEFYFTKKTSDNRTPADVELIISKFQTTFWIEDKKWFVNCDCDTSSSYGTIDLYSIPICYSVFKYQTKLTKFSMSSYPIIMNNNNVTFLSLTMNKSLADDIQEKKTITNYPIFPAATGIELTFPEYCSALSLESLCTFIDISRIVHMKIRTYFKIKFQENLLLDIKIFIEQVHNLSSLDIVCIFHQYELDQFIEKIYPIFPRRLKHLKISANNLEQVKFIVERCENLATIKFKRGDTEIYESIIKWFAENTVNTTCHKGDHDVAVWIGKNHINPIDR